MNPSETAYIGADLRERNGKEEKYDGKDYREIPSIRVLFHPVYLFMLFYFTLGRV